ncbi:DUF1641 domain-containing protein [Aneurinibacillus terranovensis]|uniref:DUF1641 domain-containing protein n=1 Tax=Aneurinibacillus terranovensis TaxID=278991 RepID=UPI0004044628|nr:DUF1641 domain-containing protein [Aneurinibacillus terranovensis]
MARAITRIEKQIPTETQQQVESMEEILKVLSDNRKSLVAFIEIIKEAHESGIFDIIQGILKNKHEVAKVGLEFVRVAGIPSMMKNAVIAMQFLSKLDPIKVHMLLNGLNQGLEKASVPNDNYTGVWGMVKALREPEINSSINVLLNFLRGMGIEFGKNKEQVKQEIHETQST